TTEAWNHICFGSDFDGNIDPVDAFATTDKMEYFQNLVQLFIPFFVQQNTYYDATCYKKTKVGERVKEESESRILQNNPFDPVLKNIRVKEILLLKICRDNIINNQTVLSPDYYNRVNAASALLVKKVFNTNATDFILKHYGKSWSEILTR